MSLEDNEMTAYDAAPEPEQPTPPPVPPTPDPEPEPEPEPKPQPPTEAEIDAMIEAEVGKLIEDFKAEHFMVYKRLRARLNEPLEITMQSLVRDQVYKQLVADTDEAVDLGQIIKAIAEIVLMVAGKFLPLL